MESQRYLFNSFLFILFIFQFSFSSNDTISPEKIYTTTFTNITTNETFSLDLDVPSWTSNYYLHFSTSPLTANSTDMQQIIYSPEREIPTPENAGNFSFRYSRNAKLIALAPNEMNKIYITLRCFKYPCSFNFSVRLEKDLAYLDWNENQNFLLFNSNSFGREKFNKINFTFPEIKERNDRIILSVLNVDGDLIRLLYSTNNSKRLAEYKQFDKINRGALYIFDNEIHDLNRFILEIISSDNKIITLSVFKSSNNNEGLILSEITPNTFPKLSGFNGEKDNIEQCFKLNTDYINNFVNNEDDLLYASINYFSSPAETFLNYHNNLKEIENKEGKNYINIILVKESNEYPQICFKPKSRSSMKYVFMIEVSHIYKGMENIDINFPIFSGTFTTKTLLPFTLGVYSHYTDVQYIDKISFHLKPITGKPSMFFVQCEDYPNCYYKHSDMVNKSDVFPSQDFGQYQFFTKKFENKTKDMSPLSSSVNLLYVYCPATESVNCKFEILVYSDIEEIILEKNREFNIVAEKDEILRFKYIEKKGSKFPHLIDFCLNVEENDVFFDEMKEVNNATVIYLKKDKMNCYRYKLDKKYHNIKENDIEIVFDIKAEKDLNYTLQISIPDIASHKIGEIINVKNLSFPYELNYLIEEEQDLLFNIYLTDNNRKGIDFTQIEISYIILNESYLDDDIEGTKETLDPATRTAVITINKDYINQNIGNKNELYFLNIAIMNKNINNNINIEDIGARMFLVNKQNLTDNILPKDSFISDKIIINNSNIFNLYHIKTEKNTFIEIKFSSNYQINDNFLVYFLEYNNETFNIDYIEKNKKPYNTTSNGQMYSFLYDNKETNSDFIFAVVSKLTKEKTDLKEINYIFKYKTYVSNEEYDESSKYFVNDSLTIENQNDKYIIQFDSIKKDNLAISNELYYIRKISENKKIKDENFSTYAKIQSEYELIQGEKSVENGKVKLTLPKMENPYGFYSILIDYPDDNEKFAVSKKYEKANDGNEGNDKNGEEKDNSLILKIVLPIVGGVVLIAVIIIIIVCVRKKKGTELKKSIMKTSFQEEGDLLDRNYINEEEN